LSIEVLEGLPDNVLAFEAAGKVTDSDYEDVLIPAVEESLKTQDKVRLLYVLGSRFEGYEAEAMWDDAKLGLGHLGSWEKIALVTDQGLLRGMVKAMGFAMPGEVKVFSLDELEQAKSWVSS
jgi:hypothetical protein